MAEKETNSKKITPEDLIVVITIRDKEHVFSDVKNKLGQKAADAYNIWCDVTVNQPKGWQQLAQNAGTTFRDIAGFDPEQLNTAIEQKKIELKTGTDS